MNNSSDLCRCGHTRLQHIHEEGACRPGFVCDKACDQYQDRAWKRIRDALVSVFPDVLAAVIIASVAYYVGYGDGPNSTTVDISLRMEGDDDQSISPGLRFNTSLDNPLRLYVDFSTSDVSDCSCEVRQEPAAALFDEPPHKFLDRIPPDDR